MSSNVGSSTFLYIFWLAPKSFVLFERYLFHGSCPIAIQDPSTKVRFDAASYTPTEAQSLPVHQSFRQD